MNSDPIGNTYGRLTVIKKGRFTTRQYWLCQCVKAWGSMNRRCYAKTSHNYSLYGARGIRVCERWRHSFENFFADMGTRPDPSLSLERIDNNGDYTPENCKWATSIEQSNNRRSSVFLTFAGKTQTIAQWAREIGLTTSALWLRLNQYHWPLEKALTEGNYRAN